MKSIIQKFGLAVAAMAIIFTGCKDDEKDPVVPTFSSAAVEVSEGNAVTATIVTGTEPFTVQSSDNAKATATVDGKTITITGVAAGAASITVTGSDKGAANLAVAISQRPVNAPRLNTAALELEVDFTATNAITGGTAPFTASSSDNTIATATVAGNTVTVKGIDGGTALITVKGADNGTATFAVTVNDEQILFGPDKKQFGNGLKSFDIKKSHTIRKGVYTLVGWIYVHEGATLTIEPGTVFKGTNINHDGRDVATGSSLIIMQGAKINAQGTAAEPIVFTSAKPKGQRQAADWGGIIICGNAKNNMTRQTIEGGVQADHGGSDDEDNSGVLSYVRIEFGGYPFAQDNEINGLTLGSVGRQTKIDHVQVSYSGDDSFEWFGGTVSAKHLIAYHGWDDDFDTDAGFSGKIQFALSVRDPKIADTSNSNGFESDNNSSGSGTPYTSCVFSNITVIGPIGQDPDFANTAAYINGYDWGETRTSSFQIKPGIFQAAMHIRRNSRLNCFNSVFTGFPVGLILDNAVAGTHAAATGGDLKLRNIHFAGMGMLGATNNSTSAAWNDDPGAFSATYFNTAGYNNVNHGSIDALKLKQPKSKMLPLEIKQEGGNRKYAVNDLTANWGPTTGSPLLGAANFTDPLLSGFETVTYVGAFASDADADNWTKGWANFDPQNTDY